MTPFMLKHVQNYMLQNQEMMNVASLANNVPADLPSTASNTKKHGSKAQTTNTNSNDPFSTTPEQEESEMNEAASLGIIDEKYAQNNDEQQ